MLVCPTCRSENLEDARFCTSCGRSLAPEEARMARPQRREVEDEGIDIPMPGPRSPLPGIAALVAVVLVVGGIGLWFAFRPNPCEDKFTSEQFPYCVAVPSGWQQSPLTIQGTMADAFAPPTQETTVLVVAQQAPAGLDTRGYTDSQRSLFQSRGLFPSQPRHTSVAGAEAMLWRVTDTEEDGTKVVSQRITLVRDGVAWLIALLGDPKNVTEAAPTFERMLSSWTWK